MAVLPQLTSSSLRSRILGYPPRQRSSSNKDRTDRKLGDCAVAPPLRYLRLTYPFEGYRNVASSGPPS